MLVAKRRLTQLFAPGSRDALVFNVGTRTFEPAQTDDVISVSDVIVQCEEGMASINGSVCGEPPKRT